MSQVRDLRGLSPAEEIKLMNDEQLLCRKQTLEDYFGNCKRDQQGVGTKERAWYRLVIERLNKHFGYSLSDLNPVTF